jgi:hypothetical protein
VVRTAPPLLDPNGFSAINILIEVDPPRAGLETEPKRFFRVGPEIDIEPKATPIVLSLESLLYGTDRAWTEPE